MNDGVNEHGKRKVIKKDRNKLRKKRKKQRKNQI